MRVFRHFAPFPADARGGVFAIGNFDGVHLGHQRILTEAREESRRRAASFGVLTFEPHPRQFFRPGDAPFRLTPFRSKMHVFEQLACDVAISLHFDEIMAQLPARDFVQQVLVEALNVAHIVVGYDFVFGHKRSGTVDLLCQLADEFSLGFTCQGPVCDETGTAYSSTEIRTRLAGGDVRGAAAFLGRHWEICGRVELGDQRGRTIGFPTANIQLGEYLRPAPGVYATKVGIERHDGSVEWREGVANIGVRPTVGGMDVRLEVHLFDFSDDLYGRNLRVLLIDHIREERKFGGLAELKDQIARDAETARAIHRREQA